MYDLLDRKMRSAERYGQSVGLLRVRMNQGLVQSFHESEIINCAEMLTRQLRPDDIVGRMGIYEFLIVLGQDSSNSGYSRAFEKIVARCKRQSSLDLEFVTAESQSHEKVRDVLNRLDTQPVTFS